MDITEELNSYDSRYIDTLIADQVRNTTFLVNFCKQCKNHNVLIWKDLAFDTCNDTWSGLDVGKHITYSETIDMCIECGGFNKI